MTSSGEDNGTSSATSSGAFPKLREFRPGLILHNLGYDTCQGDYGDLGLSPEFFIDLAAEVNQCAREVCQGRYLIVTHGGCRADVAEYIFPAILQIPAEGR